MSSILKALKKVEQSGPAEESALFPTASRVPSLGARKAAPGWGRKIAAGAVAAALLIAAGLGVYYWKTGMSNLPAAAKGSKVVRAALPPSPATKAPPAPAPAPAKPPSVKPAPVPEAAENTDESPTNPAGPGRAHTLLRAPPPTSRLRPRQAPASAAVVPRTGSPRSTTPTAPKSTPVRDAATRSAEDNLERLDESKLRVMAIAWSADPSRRLAVVNGHIVREGEAVEGYSVIQIRKDDLIVNDGSRSWRLELNLKTKP